MAATDSRITKTQPYMFHAEQAVTIMTVTQPLTGCSVRGGDAGGPAAE